MSLKNKVRTKRVYCFVARSATPWWILVPPQTITNNHYDEPRNTILVNKPWRHWPDSENWRDASIDMLDHQTGYFYKIEKMTKITWITKEAVQTVHVYSKFMDDIIIIVSNIPVNHRQYINKHCDEPRNTILVNKPCRHWPDSENCRDARYNIFASF